MDGNDVEVEEPPTKKRRGPSDEQCEFKANHLYSTFQIKLKSLLADSLSDALTQALHDLFNDTAANITRNAFEAYLLANVHVLRLIEEGKELPDLDQTFFTSVCTLVTRGGRRNAGNDELRATRDQYVALRPGGHVWAPAENALLSHSRASLARDMAVATKNHIIENFEPRILRYIRVRYALSKKYAKTFLDMCLDDRYPDNAFTDDQRLFKNEFLGIPADWPAYTYLKDMVRDHPNHFLKILYKVLVYYESLDPLHRGVRKFTLLPTKDSYVGQFTFIDRTTLPDLLKRMDEARQRELADKIVALVQNDADVAEERAVLEARLQNGRVFFDRLFYQKEKLCKILWQLLFNFERYETGRRQFAYLISTDGCAVTVYMQIPKPAGFVDADGRGSDHFDPVPDSFDEFNRFIGLDPGRTYPASAYAGENTARNRSRCVQVSTKEIRHESKMTEHAIWNRQLRANAPEYEAAIRTLPSLKTASFAQFKERVQQTLLQAEFLFSFSQAKAFRNRRFKVSRFSKRAMVKTAKKIIAKPGFQLQDPKKVLIGFGDWSQQDGFLKGTPKAPIKKLRRALHATGATVIKIDEFRTSKCCSACCTSFVNNVRYRAISGRMVKSHQAVRCRNSACGVYWQRDCNASRNIRNVLMSVVEGRARPPYLGRGRKYSAAGRLLPDADPPQ